MYINSFKSLPFLNFAVSASGEVAPAGASVDIVHHIGVEASVNGLVLTLPAPTVASDITARVSNTGLFPFEMFGVTIAVDEYAEFQYNDLTWHAPASRPPFCPSPLTRAELLAIRNAGGLNKECHYVVSDYNRGTVGPAEILLHAVDANTLTQDVSVKTGFDNTAWAGRYDIDSNRIMELRDNLGNVVNGQESVDVFPWGNPAVYDNFLDEPNTFTYTQGNVVDNRFETGSVVILNGAAGNFARNVIGEDSNIDWQSGDFRDNQIGTDAVVNVNTTGDFDNNEVHSFAVVNVTGTANADQNRIAENANVTLQAGSFTNNNIGTDAVWNGLGGSVYENSISNGSTVTQTTTKAVYQNIIDRVSTVTLGDFPFYANKVGFSLMNFTGSTGNGIRYCVFEDARTINAQNVVILDWAYSRFGTLSSMAVNGAQRVYLRQAVLETNGRVLQSAGTLLDLISSQIGEGSYAQILQGRLYITSSSVTGVSYIQNNTTGTNRVDRLNMNSFSRVRFLGTSTGCRVYYCEVSSGSYIEMRGSALNCYAYYNEVTSSSAMYMDSCSTSRVYYNSVSGNSEISAIGMTGAHYFYYCVAAAHGYLRQRDGRGRFYAVHASGQSVITLTGGGTASALYYSTFHAYFYLNLTGATLTTTRYGWHGYGRETYAPAAMPPNGPATRNF